MGVEVGGVWGKVMVLEMMGGAGQRVPGGPEL